jgi:DNA polymerase III delta subunit
MHYLLLGTDISLKDTQLQKIKREFFPDGDSFRMDCETLDGFKLSTEKLKIALLSLPALAERRLIIVRHAERLSKENLELLEDFLKSTQTHASVVLDAAMWEAKSEARKNILLAVRTIGREEAAGVNVFDMMDLVGRGDVVRALGVLKEVIDRDGEPERVLGGMLWSWSNKVKPRVPAVKYKKGLLILQEADHQLKRVRFPEREYALEIALVRLFYLLKV